MKKGRGSQTAVMVCSWRAIAHRQAKTPLFSDPTAYELLPAKARKRVEQVTSGPAKGLRARVVQGFLDKRVQMMVARTVAIDAAVRELRNSQVVILGAGLDGRAWRMSELSQAIVFEVDHPDSQRDKRERVASLTQRAREVRFVSVDFTRDSLDEALAKAGHDPTLPTTWIWEGVVMYLTPAAVETTLGLVAKRSAVGSRLVVLYHTASPMLHLVGFLLRRLGEPLRSEFSVDQMAALLRKYAFGVTRDDGLPALGKALSEQIGQATKFMRHTRIAIADR